MQRRVGETLLTELVPFMCGQVLQVVQEGELVPPWVLKLLEASDTFGTVRSVSRELLLATSVVGAQMCITAWTCNRRQRSFKTLEFLRVELPQATCARLQLSDHSPSPPA